VLQSRRRTNIVTTTLCHCVGAIIIRRSLMVRSMRFSVWSGKLSNVGQALDGWPKIYYLQFLRASEGTLRRWSRLHMQSLAPTNQHWTHVVSYGTFSLWLMYPSNGGIIITLESWQRIAKNVNIMYIPSIKLTKFITRNSPFTLGIFTYKHIRIIIQIALKRQLGGWSAVKKGLSD
jgi:hypothetical protein